MFKVKFFPGGTSDHKKEWIFVSGYEAVEHLKSCGYKTCSDEDLISFAHDNIDPNCTVFKNDLNPKYPWFAGLIEVPDEHE